MNHEPLLCGTATCNTTNITPVLLNCRTKSCQKELSYYICPSNECPLKKHKSPSLIQDAAFEKDNCENVISGCFCKKQCYTYKDVIARCEKCDKDYHICPVAGCGKPVPPSRRGKSGPSEGFRELNEHLRTNHNGFPTRKAQRNLDPPRLMIPNQISTDQSDDSLLNIDFIDPIPVDQIPKDDIIPFVNSAILASSNSASQIAATVMDRGNQNPIARDTRIQQWRISLQKIREMLKSGNFNNDVVAAHVMRLKREVRNLEVQDIDINFDKLEGIVAPINIDIEEATRKIDMIVAQFDDFDREFVLRVRLNNENSSPQLAISQKKMVEASKAKRVNKNYFKSSIVFFLFYNANQLCDLLQENGEGFFPKKLPVQFVATDGKNIDKELDVLSWELIIPLDASLEQKLAELDLISQENSIYAKSANVRWYWINDKEGAPESEDEEEIKEFTVQETTNVETKHFAQSSEIEFYRSLSDEFGESFVNKLRKKKFYKRNVNWYILHKCATELSYKPKTGSSKQSNKFQRVIEKYLERTTDENNPNDQEFRQKALFRGGDLKKSYDNSCLASFMFDFSETSNLQKSPSTGSSVTSTSDEESKLKKSESIASSGSLLSKDEDEGNDMHPSSDIIQVEKFLEEIQKAPINKDAGGKEVFKLVKRIQVIVNESKLEHLPLPDTRNILLFGRNGQGKSTLINMILFSTTIKVDNNVYQKNNSFFNFRDFEAIRYLSSLININQVESLKQELGEKWSDIVEGENESNNSNLSKSKPSLYELVDFSDLVTKEGKWKNEEGYKNESSDLEKLSSGDEFTMLGVIKPFILLNSGKGNQGSCTAHLTRVRYGNRWQAVVELLSLKEILARFDEGDDVGDMKSNLWEKLVILENDNIEDTSSQSKKMKDDIPKSNKEAETNLPQQVVDHLRSKQGFVILSTGNDIHVDRMIVRSKMFKIVEKYGPLIKDITVFAPSPLLNQYPLSLVDAPGDDDADWAKGKQLERACKIADAVVVVSKRDFSAGVTLNSFAKYFGPAVLKRNHSIPMFVVLREDSENKSSVDDLKQLPSERKEKEKTKTIQLIRKAFINFGKTFAETSEEKKDFEQKAKSLEIDGGYFFYTWCAMRAFGNAIKNDSEKQILLEESGYNDLEKFIPSVAKNVEKENQVDQWKKLVLTMIKNVKQEIMSSDNKKIQEFILEQLKHDYDDKAFYDFKEELFKHSFFWDSTTGQGVNRSNGKESLIGKNVNERCTILAKKISALIKEKLNGDLKQDFVSRVELNWSTENWKYMLSPGIPDVIVQSESRIFPEFIAPLLNSDDFIQFVDAFQKDVLQEYIECANQAIVHHILNKRVNSLKWKNSTSTRRNTLLITAEELWEEALNNDENLKQTYDFIKKIQMSEEYENDFRRKIDLVLWRYKREFLKGKELFSNVKMAIKIHVFNHLKNKIHDDIDANEVLHETIQALSEENLTNVLSIEVENTFKDVLKILFKNFVVRTRLPIIRTLYTDFLKDPVPSIPENKMKPIEEYLSKIEKICGKQISEKSLAASSTTISS